MYQQEECGLGGLGVGTAGECISIGRLLNFSNGIACQSLNARTQVFFRLTGFEIHGCLRACNTTSDDTRHAITDQTPNGFGLAG